MPALPSWHACHDVLKERKHTLLFVPAVEGDAAVRARAHPFFAAFARRIEQGLLPGAPSRSKYAVTLVTADRLEFRAETWLTAFNVGLNDVKLAMTGDGRVRYDVRYHRWAAFAVVLSGMLGLFFIAFFTLYDVRGYLARNPAGMIPGLSMDQNLAIGWAMALFWGFAWPWLLVAMHKGPLRRLMERIIAEVDAAAAGGA